jgi:hypothetical protein
MASVKNLRALFKNTLQILDPEYRENNDGSTMTVYANVVTTATEKVNYRVTISTHYEPGKKVVRIVDMYSLDDKMHASITGIMREDLGSWNEIYSCSDEELAKPRPYCPHHDFVAERLLNEVTNKTMVRENAIGNMEVFLAWEQGTKDMVNQIISK